MLQATLKETVALFRVHCERICKCLGMLEQEQIWHDFNENLVSVGNLVLHLEGNLSQHVWSGLGGREFTRHRSLEFTDKPDIGAAELQQRLKAVINKVEEVVLNLDETALQKEYTIQGTTYTGIGDLLHVLEHFSYHAGQITSAVKILQNVDVGYYEDEDLEQQ
jgi:uncharacterized damage-inducible protein DinB